MKNITLSLKLVLVLLVLFSCHREQESDLFTEVENSEKYDFITILEESKNSITYSIDYNKLKNQSNLKSNSIKLNNTEYKLVTIENITKTFNQKDDSKRNSSIDLTSNKEIYLMPVITDDWDVYCYATITEFTNGYGSTPLKTISRTSSGSQFEVIQSSINYYSDNGNTIESKGSIIQILPQTSPYDPYSELLAAGRDIQTLDCGSNGTRTICNSTYAFSSGMQNAYFDVYAEVDCDD